MKDDEKALVAVGGGVALYVAYKWRSTGEQPQFQLPSLGGGGGVSLDLSNLLGGLGGGGLGDISGLLGGLKADDAAVRDFLGSCLSGGAAQQGGDPKDQTQQPVGGGSGGQEPTSPLPDGFWQGASGLVNEVAGTSPWFQGGLGVLLGGLGVGTGYAMVRTAPALGRAAMYAVQGTAGVARSLGNVISAGASRLLSHGTTRVVTNAGVARVGSNLFRPTIGPMSYRGMSALGKTGVGMGLGSLLALASAVAAIASTTMGRVLFGEEAPEKVVGWNVLSALSPSEWIYGMLGGKVSAAQGEGWSPSPFGGDVTPWATQGQIIGNLLFAGAPPARAGVSGWTPSPTGGDVTPWASPGVVGAGAARGQAVLGARAQGQATLGGAPSGGKAPATPTGMATPADETAYWSYT